MYRPQQQSTDRESGLVNFCGSEKAAHHTSSVGLWLLMAAIVVDVLRSSQVRHTASWHFGRHGTCMNKRLAGLFAMVIALLAGGQAVWAAAAPALSQVKVLKVESPACGFEDIAPGQEQTRCNHSGPNIKVYVLEVGYGRAARVGLDGFDLNGTRTPVCAFDNGNLTECTVGRKTVGYLYVFDLAGKQEGTFTFSNTSINAPGNTLSTQLYIK
jgi:hypothetical protein